MKQEKQVGYHIFKIYKSGSAKFFKMTINRITG